MSSSLSHTEEYLQSKIAQTEAELNKIFRTAHQRLDQLISEERLSPMCAYTSKTHNKVLDESSVSRSTPFEKEQIEYQLQLGSTRLTPQQLSELTEGTIVPLLDSTSGQIQIWSNGRIFGRGVLLVVNGQFAVKLETIE